MSGFKLAPSRLNRPPASDDAVASPATKTNFVGEKNLLSFPALMVMIMGNSPGQHSMMLIRSDGKQAGVVGRTKVDTKQRSNSGKTKQRGNHQWQHWGDESKSNIITHVNRDVSPAEHLPVEQPARDPLHLQLHPPHQACGRGQQEGGADEGWGEDW